MRRGEEKGKERIESQSKIKAESLARLCVTFTGNNPKILLRF